MRDIPLTNLQLRKGTGLSLVDQICQAIRQRITEGQLKAGQRLPASRKFATELGVSRITISTAYEQLCAEGFLRSRIGSGVYVSDIGEVEALAKQPPNAAYSKSASKPTAESHSTVLRPLTPGQPDPRLFPHREWSRLICKVARNQPQALVDSGSLFGDTSLRQEICRYVEEWRGISASPTQVIVTAGALDALDLCLRTLATPNNVTYVEDPGYPPVNSLLESLSLPFEYLRTGHQGAEVPSSASRNNIAVITPSLQFPLGGSMPLAKLKDFLSWARNTGSWLIEDDYDSEFRYAGRPIPALFSLQDNQQTLYVGSFSKVFSAGLRLGYLVIPPSLVERFQNALQRHRSRTSPMPQRPLALFMQEGGYYRHIRRMRRIYKDRRDVLIKQLRQHLSEFIDSPAKFSDHKAGMHLLIRLAADLPDKDICLESHKQGLGCQPLSRYCTGTQAQNGLLLGFCGFSSDEIEDAISRLATIVKHHRQ